MTGHAGGSANNPLRSSSFVTAVQTTPTGLTEAEARATATRAGQAAAAPVEPLLREHPGGEHVHGSERDPAGVRGADDHLRVMEGRVVLGILVANIAIECFQEIAPNGSLIGSPR